MAKISVHFVSFLIIACTSSLAKGDIRGIVNELYRYKVDYNTRIEMYYPLPQIKVPYRIEVTSVEATREKPVLVVVRQEKSVSSWQLPLLVESHSPESFQGFMEYSKTARTLCYSREDDIRADKPITSVKVQPSSFNVSLSTFSEYPVWVTLRAVYVENYYIQTDRDYEVSFSPSEPVYFVYDFPYNDIKTVMLQVTSEDDVCFTVSVQPNICPIYDLNDYITYQGKFQTVTKKGGIAVYRKDFRQSHPEGFVIVFVAKADNYECNMSATLTGMSLHKLKVEPYRNKQTSSVTFRVRTAKKEGEYTIAIFSLLALNVALCFVILLLTYIFYRFGAYYKVEEIDGPAPYCEPDEDDIDRIQESSEPKLKDFIYHGERNSRKALNYFWHIANIAIFYGLPVIQLMIFYQRAVDFSGDMDLCYYNNQCSHPLYFTDFNHVYSNVGYMIFGVLLLSITAFRNRYVRNKKNCGVPKLHGLYYAMGVALIFEGLLSGCYHICPNQSNFQFDTSFMYVMAILIMAKLYQNRHPDVQASAYATFTVLGLAVIVAMFGILYNSLAVLIIFFIAYVLLCVYMSFKLYFFTNVVKRVKHIYHEAKSATDGSAGGAKPWIEVLSPKRRKQFIFLVIGNSLNFMMAVGGFFLYPDNVDFGTYLLTILMGNAIMYAIFYTSMKIITAGEYVCWEAVLYGVLSMYLWVSGGYFFFNAATHWSQTPAQSRTLNQDCLVLDFYDTHDVWHIISAPALFFSFLFLMALDDDLYDKPQNTIDVF